MVENSMAAAPVPGKRRIPVLNLVVFPISILLYLITYAAIANFFRGSFAELLALVYFAVEIAVFVLSVLATIRTARNMMKYKGLGFAITSLVLTFIPAVFGPIFFLLYSIMSLR